MEIDLFIFDINGTSVLTSGIRTGARESTWHPGLKAGTYFLRVYRTGGTGTYSLLNKFTAAPYSNDNEPNDNVFSSVLLTLNSQTTGHINYYSNGSKDSDDWYKFTISVFGGIKFTIESDSSDIDLYILDINSTSVIKNAIKTGLKEEIEFPNLMPGTYFLRVYGTSSHGGYILTNTFVQTSINGVAKNDSENNSTYQTAMPLAQFNGNSSTTTYGTIGFYTNGFTDYDDYWIIETGTDGKLVVNTESNPTTDIDLYLLDVNGTSVIRTGLATGINEQITFENLGIGKFYLRVYRTNGYGSYKLTAAYTIPALPMDSEPNDSYTTSRSISPNVKLTGHLGYFANNLTDTDDYYAFTLSSKWDSLYVRTDSESPLDIDLYLLNSSQATIATSFATGKKELLKTTNVAPGTYYIRAYKTTGQGSYAIQLSSKYIGIDLTDVAKNILPSEYNLSQNYPNPFNPVTRINYSLPKDDYVSIKIFDVLGREVMLLVNEFKHAGNYSVELNGSSLVSGAYIYQMETNNFKSTKKLLLLK